MLDPLPSEKTSGSRLQLAALFLGVLLGALSPAAWAGGCPAVDTTGCEDLSMADDNGDIDTNEDLDIDGVCYTVTPTSENRTLRHVHVRNGGRLYFLDAGGTIDFRISGLLVEQGGLVQAGSPSCPFGSENAGSQLEIGLWGSDPTQLGTVTNIAGLQCKSHGGQCYDPALVVTPPSTPMCCVGTDPTDPCNQACGARSEYNAAFEGYAPLNYDGMTGDADSGQNFFGFKAVAVSYGGQLLLYGDKGADYSDSMGGGGGSPSPACPLPDAADYHDLDAWARASGTSWARLRATASGSALNLDRQVDWEAGDRVVVSTTDWYPGHSELRSVRGMPSQCTSGSCTGTCPDASCTDLALDRALDFEHQGAVTPVPANLTNDAHGNPNTAIETRAAVGLLSRDIVIYSLGETATDPFPAASDCRYQDVFPSGTFDDSEAGCFFGGHVIVRQGFGAAQFKGVEFRQLGQGGRMGHYPLHFHLAKDTSYTRSYPAQTLPVPGTFVQDSSIWDSNTRFVVLHGTHDVEVARNVGFLSVGHGFYLEDGSEIDNALCHNLGVSARGPLVEHLAALGETSACTTGMGAPSCRAVPPIVDGAFHVGLQGCKDENTCPMTGCCDDPTDPCCDDPNTTYLQGSDDFFPVMFWAMNAHNELVGNQATGMHGFGSCYWLLGSGVSGPSKNLTWAQDSPTAPTVVSASSADYANFNSQGKIQAPVKEFRGNACSTAAYGLQSTLQINPTSIAETGYTRIENPYGWPEPNIEGNGNYHRPRIDGNFLPRRFRGSVGESPDCSSGVDFGNDFSTNSTYCRTTVIDHFTTSFNWSQVNFGSIWLRPEYYLFINGAISDQLFGGLGFVSGGSWSQVPPGYFTVTKDGLFTGSTRPLSATAGRTGPTIVLTDDHCTGGGSGDQCCAGATCMLPDEGIGIFNGGLNPKRLITIYDGPFYGEGNIFFDTESFACDPTSYTSADSCGIYLTTFQPGFLSTGSHACASASSPYGQGTDGQMIVADAAIGWKQTNGFYYPPAFAFRKSAFDQPSSSDLVSRRHNVLDQYLPYLRSFAQNPGDVRCMDPFYEQYPDPTLPPSATNDMSSVDFSTILNDLDGSLTGMVVTDGAGPSPNPGPSNPGPSSPGGAKATLSTRTAAVSENRFFDAPSQHAECESLGSQTSAYEFVTSLVAPVLASGGDWFVNFDQAGNWSNPAFPTVPIYRQFLVDGEEASCGIGLTPMEAAADPAAGAICDGTEWACERGTFMAGAQAGQAPYLTMNNGLYYIDTDGSNQPLSCVRQAEFWLPPFSADASYLVWQLFAKPDTEVTYQLHVGDAFSLADDFSWVRVFPHENAPGMNGNDNWVETVTDASLLSALGTPHFDPCTGVLTVSIDQSALAPRFTFSARTTDEKCVPRDLCEIDGSGDHCVAAVAGTDPLHGAVDSVCRSWVTTTAGTGSPDSDMTDLSLADCPEGGCLGFVFTLPTGFTAKSYAEVMASYMPSGAAPGTEPDWDQYPATCFPNDATWNRPLALDTAAYPNDSCPAPSAPSLPTFCSNGNRSPAAPEWAGESERQPKVHFPCPTGCCIGGDSLFEDDFESGGTGNWGP